MKAASDAWLSDSRLDPTLAWMVLLSLLVHLAAGVVILLLPRNLFTPVPPPVVAYTVKIVDQSALGGRLPKGPLQPEVPPEAPKSQPPPEEPKQEAKPEPKPPEKEPEPPEPEEKAVVLPDKKAKEKPTPKPEKPTPRVVEKATPKPSKAEASRDRRDRSIQEAIARLEKGKSKQAAGLGGQEEGKGAALGVGGDGGGGGILTGLDFILYKNQVESIIKKNWTWVGADPDLTIRVGFRIGEDGSISDLRIVERSRDSSYDESVMKAIRLSSPLPVPPEKYRTIFANYVLEFLSGQLAAGG